MSEHPIYRPVFGWLTILLTLVGWLIIFAVSYGIYLLSGVLTL
jgi:hypothetical protein